MEPETLAASTWRRRCVTAGGRRPASSPAIAWLVASATLGAAEPRIALVIGNGGYQNVTRLDNPVADGELMATTLKASAST